MPYEEIHSPEEMTEFIVKTANKYNAKLDPNGRGMKDAICIEHGFQTDDLILNHVLDSGEDKTKGIVQSGWLRGNVYKVISPAETDAILQFCKIALKSVFREAAERYEIEKKYNPDI